ncbi:MAG TPA: four helix bundle protein [Cyclobacteriaceae bacterium]|nr:four helix bundle protein [Cyclobacteriaceae bacterium]
MKNYKDLRIYKTSHALATKVHRLSMNLPKFEMYEQGSQVRRSSKSVAANIVEGYGRKRYRDDFIRFLTFAQSSCDETTFHLSMLSEIHFVDNPLNEILNEYDILGKKINKFIQYVERNWNKPPDIIE